MLHGIFPRAIFVTHSTVFMPILRSQFIPDFLKAATNTKHSAGQLINSLKRTGVTSVGDVLDLLDKGDDAVKSIRNFGEKSLDELRAKLQEKGYLKKDKESE